MPKLTLLLLSLLTAMNAIAQQSSIKGNVTDTIGKETLHHAVVSLLRQKDSVLVKFIRTDNKGNFELKGIAAGKYYILISYPLYADYADKIELTENETKDLGIRPLIQKAKLLEEVIVKQTIAAIRIKGDTTEYKADSFRVGANANVQDLLKRLPGIQVNSKGEITAQGEKVKKILVDGEEFFSDDPAVVAQTLRADVVNTVQVFDKKSDQAVFSGIDDGEKTKTINLELKDDKKKGYFGKAEVGSDFDYYKNAKLMVNSFKGKRKVAGYITYDNTKFSSLNWKDRDNYGGDMSNNVFEGEDGGMYMYSEGDDYSEGEALPNAITAGLLYSKKWNKDKQNMNANYQYNNLEVHGLTKDITQNILDSGSFNSFRQNTYASIKKRHQALGVYDFAIDTTSSLKVTIKGSIANAENNGNAISSSATLDSFLLNRSYRTTSGITENKTLTTTIFYRKRFKKKGRTLSFNTDLNSGGYLSKNYLEVSNYFYDKAGLLDRKDSIDQYKPSNNTSSTLNAKISYTEPLWKNTFLELNYKYSGNKNDAERITYSRANSGKYDFVVDTLTNHYRYNNNSNSGGFNIRYNEKKFNFSIGTGIGSVSYKQTDVITKQERNIRFTNLLPGINFALTPSKQTRLSLSYHGNARNPTLQEIQPLKDNSDGINIFIGNAELRQEFRHNFRLSFSDYKILKSRNIYIGAYYSTVNNAISSTSRYDSGRTITQYVNVNGSYNGDIYSYFGFEVAPSLNMSVGFDPAIRRSVNFVTTKGLPQKNVSDNISLNYRLSLNYDTEKWFNFNLSFNANQNRSTSSINPGLVTRYWNFGSDGHVNLKLPKKFYLDIEEEINIYEKTAAFANASDFYILNASIKKSLTKDENWQVKFSANDILNQKQSIHRNITTNSISETTNQTIQRFFLFSLIYNFNKNGKPQNDF